MHCLVLYLFQLQGPKVRAEPHLTLAAHTHKFEKSQVQRCSEGQRGYKPPLQPSEDLLKLPGGIRKVLFFEKP